MEIETAVSPAMLVGATSPGGSKLVSPEAQDLLDRLKTHYQSLGKNGAAHSYHRHLKSFFAWAEHRNMSIRSLPPESVESFLTDLHNAGQKESTIYVMRTQLKSALRECHNSLGVDFGHLEYQTGKPREVRRQQKQREKNKRHEKKAAQTIAQAQAILAAREAAQAMPRADIIPPSFNFSDNSVPQTTVLSQEEHPMTIQSAPDNAGSTLNGAAANGQQPVVVVQMPQQNQRPVSTIGANRSTATATAGTTTVGKGMTINTHVFSGPYVRISRMADGTDPLTPPGTETYITTVPLTQLQPHGDVAAYLQSFVIPNLRLSPMVTQVHFIFHELNDRRQPTGRRDELVVSMPLAMNPQTPQTATSVPVTYGASATAYAPMDRSTDFLLKKLDEEAGDAKRRAEALQDQLRETKDAQATFMLMQQFQKEQELRRELEDRKGREMERQSAMHAMYAAPPSAPVVIPEPPRADSGAEMAKAFAESQAKMMEAMMNGIAAARNVPAPAPQKDAAEWLVPFLAQMNQQQQAQQQANQQMIVQIMQNNQQFMQALITRESPELKFLMTELKEVKAAANAPKGDEMEDFADKLSKVKMVSEMLNGGNANSGGSSLIGELLANAEAIGEGAAKIISASKSRVVLPTTPALSGVPTARTLPVSDTATANAAPQMPPLPDGILSYLDALDEAAKSKNDQQIVDAVTSILSTLMEAPEPYPRMAQRFVLAFRNMDDAEEMYTFAKTLFTVGNRKADKDTCKAVAAVLVTWYEVIHEQMFGVAKKIGEVLPEIVQADGDGDEAEGNDEDAGEDEDDLTSVES